MNSGDLKPDDLVLICRASLFVAGRHGNELRKGRSGAPYLTHVAEVAGLVAEATDGNDAELIAAAYLHDTLEDTSATYYELENLFGPEIAELVEHVSDDMSRPKAERWHKQILNAAALPLRAKYIRIADKASNLRGVLIDPPDWSDSTKYHYFGWAKSVVDRCRGTNSFLEDMFDETYYRGILRFRPEKEGD